jgi:hypothetical protein
MDGAAIHHNRKSFATKFAKNAAKIAKKFLAFFALFAV